MSTSEGMPVIPSIVVGVAGCIMYFILSFYYKVTKFPKGPTPLPFVGNILNFRSKPMHEALNEMSCTYSPVYTIYLGPKPIIVISDSKLGVESMRKAAFAGRPDYGIMQIMYEEDSIDVFFADFSREWEVLKKVAHEAIKKYTASARHPHLVSGVVDRLFDRTDADGKRLDLTPHDDFSLMMNSILASAAFGKEFEFDDPEFLSWKKSVERQGGGTGKLILIFFVPLFKFIFRDTWTRFVEEKDFQRDFVKKFFEENRESFDGTVSNFCQALIAAKQEAELEDKNTSKFMTFNNLNNVVMDLFFAGTDTTKMTMAWIFLFICKNRDMQDRIRREVIDVVGSAETIPLPEHKNDCHFTMAFIAEVMRFRTIIPNSVPHRTTTDTTLAGYRIPKGTIVLHPAFKGLNDKEYWTDPDIFHPERFIVDGKFSKTQYTYFAPFGVGRRSCPGNQLALLTMFLVIARLMQRIDSLGVNFSIRGGNDSVGLNGQLIGAQWPAEKYSMILTD